MANTYNDTDWSTDGNTKGSATSSTVDNVALGGTLSVTGASTLSSTLAVGGDANFDSNTLFVDASTNRVGVGTSTPASIFHLVSGTTDNPMITLDHESTSNVSQGGTVNFVKRDTDGAVLADNIVLGDIGFRGVEAGGTERSGAMIRGRTQGVWADGGNCGTELAFYTAQTTGSGTHQRMCIQKDGKVGIGTDSPLDALHIKGVDDEVTTVLIQGEGSHASSHYPCLRFIRSKNAGLVAAGDKLGSIQFGGYLGSTGGDFYTNYEIGASISAWCEADPSDANEDIPTSIRFFTAPNGSSPNTERMRIMDDGKVGIGTTSPEAYLHVTEDTDLGTSVGDKQMFLKLSGDSANNDYLETSLIRVSTYDGDGGGADNFDSAQWRIQRKVDSTYMGWIGFGGEEGSDRNNYGISFGVGSDGGGDNPLTVDEKMRIEGSNGYVGIGTTAPEQILHLEGSGDVGLLIRADSDNSGEQDNPLIALQQDYSAAGASGTLNNFNIGMVGTAGQIYTDSIINAKYLLAQGSHDSGSDTGVIQFVTGGHNGQDTTTNTGTPGTARMTILQNGKIGIGTTSPSTPLHVVGNITTTGYIIEGRTLIKIPATAFIANDDQLNGYQFAILENDGSNFGTRVGGAGAELFAYIDVPLGYTATKVKITGSDTANEVEVYTLDLDDGTIGSEISNSALTVADDTDLASNHVGADDKMLLIKVVTTATDDIVYGGYVTIEAT